MFVKIKLPEQLGLHAYEVSTHPDELVLEPPPEINPGPAYDNPTLQAMRILSITIF